MDLGAGPETLIGVHAERGADAIRSLLAIMKAGSGYLPLDRRSRRTAWPGYAPRPAPSRS